MGLRGGDEREVKRGMNLRETVIAEFLFQYFDEFGADVVLFVVFLILVPLFNAGVTADWGDVDHAVSTHDCYQQFVRRSMGSLSTGLLWITPAFP